VRAQIKDRQPLFTVVVPVYNKEGFVANALRSVLSQTFEDFELIVVCDPSTDNSDAEVAKFNDPRIRWYDRDEPGPGGYAARNLAIQKAKGEWIAFLDADDEWTPEFLEYAHEKSTKYQVSAMAFSYKMVGNGNGNGNGSAREDIRTICDGENLLLSRNEVLRLLKDRDVFSTNSVVIKRNVLLKVGLFPHGKNYKRGGDVDTWLRVVMAIDKVLFCPEVCSFYYLDNSGVIANKKNALSASPVLETVRRLLPEIQDSEQRSYLKQLANRKLLALIYDRKSIGASKISDFGDIYFGYLTKTQMLRAIALLLLPISIYDRVVERAKVRLIGEQS
jgi:glycosyltransferase involved in cell wall biosynthesis